jgi:hypothetical protein
MDGKPTAMAAAQFEQDTVTIGVSHDDGGDSGFVARRMAFFAVEIAAVSRVRFILGHGDARRFALGLAWHQVTSIPTSSPRARAHSAGLQARGFVFGGIWAPFVSDDRIEAALERREQLAGLDVAQRDVVAAQRLVMARNSRDAPPIRPDLTTINNAGQPSN